MIQPTRVRCLSFVLCGLLPLCLLPAPAFGQGSCVLLNGGCNPPEQPNQCFPDALGPTFWTDPAGQRTTQVRFAPQSLATTCHPPVGVGSAPHCCTSFHPSSSSAPTVKLRIVGTRIWVDYDAPNYYCQQTGDWPPFFTCTNDPIASSDNLLLFLGPSADDLSNVVSRGFIYYEDGSWDTGIDIPCQESATYSARIGFLTEPFLVVAATDSKTVTGVCPDRRDCPYCQGGAPGLGVGGPIHIGSGDVALTVPLFTLAQEPLALAFALSYHSGTPLYPALLSSPVGLGWTHSFAQTLRPADPSGHVLYHLTAEGFESLYTQTGSATWIASSPGELRGTVRLAGSQYQLTDLDGTVTAFDAATGLWLATTDRWGNALVGGYNGSGQLATVTDAAGRQIALSYSGGQLSQIALPDGELWRLGYTGAELTSLFDPLHAGATPWKSFAYGADSHGVVRLLTAVSDEAGVLLEAHGYNAADRGTSSVSAGGRDAVSVQYGASLANPVVVTHTIDGAASQVASFSLTYQRGRYLLLTVQGTCATCGGATSDQQSLTYTTDNHVQSRTDGNGNVTSYAYNADGNVTAMTEAVGTPLARTTSYSYGYAPWPNFRTGIDEPSAAKPGARRLTTLSWSSPAGLETSLVTAESGFLTPGDAGPTTYTTTRAFDARHRLLSVTGPRTDLLQKTSYSYYPDADPSADRRGRVQAMTDPSGLVTTFDGYDEFGTARSATDPNGVATQRATDGRGRIVSQTVKAVPGNPAEAVDYTSAWSYDGRDRLLRTLLPRGNGTSFGYEDGTNRRLDTIRLDGAGNQLERHHLTLNSIGDTVLEEDQGCGVPSPSCSSWTTRRSEGYAYDADNRLHAILHPVPAGSQLVRTYDADGFLAAVQDENHGAPNLRYSYDALHRVSAVAQTLAGAPAGVATTGYAYDARDNLAAVTDPNGNTTRYQYDDFRRLARQDSPVTGTTLYAYDPAGNLTSTTDARGAVTQHTYDASNRLLTSVSQLAGAATETVTYAYDSAALGSFGKGRLAQMSDPSGTTLYGYERRGLLASENRTLLDTAYATAYRYDANGNRSGITYPSGRQVAYTFDFADRPAGAAAGSTVFVASASYLPFGPESQLAFGNGTVQSRAYDLRYRPVENRLDGGSGPIADYLYGEDAVGNITSIHDALDATFNRDFAYDDLHRLTGASTGTSLWGPGGYSYDAMGNLLSLALGTTRAATFSYNGALPTLASVMENGTTRAVTYDAAGNEVGVGTGSFTYSARNLLTTGDGLSYTYDGRGVRSALAVVSSFGTVTGTVVAAATGSPLAGVSVRLAGIGLATVTDAAGRFLLAAPAGTYALTAGAGGFLPLTTPLFPLPAGTSFDVGTLRLAAAPGQITGTAVGSLDGQPLAGVAVTLAERSDTALTDAAGRFTLSEPAGSYTLTFSQAGYATLSLLTFSLAAGQIHAVGTVTLVANPATLTGTVVSSAGGAPIAGATVTAASAPGAIHAGAGVARAPTAATAASPRGAAASGAQRGVPKAGPFSATTDGFGAFSLPVAAGTYTVTIARAGFGPRTTSAVSVGVGAAYSFGTVALDPLATISGTVVRQSDGTPVGGASVTVTGTLDTAATDATGAFSLQVPAGTYTLTVTATGLATLTTSPFTVAPGGSFAAGTLRLAPVALSVYVGYADNLRASPAFPVPWQGSPNIVFFGNAGGSPVYDAGAVRLDNATDQPMAIDRVSVDLQRPGPVYQLWGSFEVPAHGTVILTQTQPFDFDTSDSPIVACGQTPAANDPRVPRVTVTVGGAGTDYFDTGHILDTGGYDLACRGNESLVWRLIGTTGIAVNGAFHLDPPTGTGTLGSPYALTATLTDANGQPLANVVVTFTAIGGPNRGMSGQATTDGAGHASFRYASTFSGTDTWQATVTNASGSTLTSNPASVLWPALSGLALFVGYGDSLRGNPAFPNPWQGSPNTLFLGGGGQIDAGAVRLDNLTAQPVTVDKVTVDLQRPGPLFDLWGSFTIPAHGSAVLTQTAEFNFDTSDFPLAGCGQAVGPNDPRIPKVNVTVGGLTASYLDTAHILDTFGYDTACQGNESLQWRPVGASGTTNVGQLALVPAATTLPVGALATLTAIATDAADEPLPNVTVTFTVLSGPRRGQTGSAVTDASGTATFRYTSSTPGTDTVQASQSNVQGGLTSSNPASVLWLPTVALSLTPATASQAVGTPYNATLLATDGSGNPVANLTVTFTVASGPNAGRTGTGTTDAHGQTVFSYTSASAGADTLATALLEAGGGTLASNSVTTTWTSPLLLTLAPPSATAPLGSSATVILTATDARNQPAANVTVTVAVVSGPNAGLSGQATTDAHGQATFTYSGSTLGTDTLQATGGGSSSNAVIVTWIAIPTRLVYTGQPVADLNDPLTLAARLTVAATGQPLAGQTVAFNLGGASLAGTTDGNGVATVALAPAGLANPALLTLAFAGVGPYTGAAASLLLGFGRDDTALVYTGSPALANGTAQPVSARLTDAATGLPLAGKTVTFTLGSATASAVTDASGNAAATLALPATLPAGPAQLQITFAGDASEQPAATTAPVYVVQPASFVLWGGNTPGLALGQHVNFWGSQWASQVSGGDYQANPSFKGFAIPAATPLALCEASARTSGTPRLDASCWTSKPGNSSPPATLGDYIEAIVSTSIAKQGSTIFGNIAALVVVRVDPSSSYAPDPGHPGFGTIVAVISDGEGLFPQAASRRAAATPGTAGSELLENGEAPGAAVASAPLPSELLASAAAVGTRRYYLYTPELHLAAETELTSGANPAVFYEYVWFGDRPAAQVDATGLVSWTFADHLGTPVLQTSGSQGVSWRAEAEPYGAVFALRSADVHQPLRLPGQEAEQLNLGANGPTERSYNIHRWYAASGARYLEADPQGLPGGINLFAYAQGRPLLVIDPEGLYTFDGPADKAGDVEAAVNLVKSKLQGKPCCAGDQGPSLLGALDNPSLVIEYKPKLKDCGFTSFSSVIGLRSRIQISPLAWSCCLHGEQGIHSLASTILHEVSHLGFGSEKRAYQLELNCFGCAPTDPKYKNLTPSVPAPATP
jgi:RHS repeat-associated protein